MLPVVCMIDYECLSVKPFGAVLILPFVAPAAVGGSGGECTPAFCFACECTLLLRPNCSACIWPRVPVPHA